MNKTKSKIQVPSSAYFSVSYNSLDRFSSFQWQIENVLKLKPKKVLEIGVGNKLVANFLKEAGISITTCDINKKVNPDVVADIKNLPFKKNEFDLIIACQILEHLPYNDSLRALKELWRVSKKQVMISLPYHSLVFYGYNKLIPFVKPFGFCIRLPVFLLKSFNPSVGTGEHYWELGTKGHSLNKMRKDLIKTGFKITKEGSPKLIPCHYFFILNKLKIK